MLLKNAHIINPADNLNELSDIRVENGMVAEISKNLFPLVDEEVIDLSGKVITPGLVDMHCHLREPGFESKETIKTGIQSALAGGYTAICPMANTSPVVDNLMTLKYTFDRAQEAEEIGFYPICALSIGLKGQNLVNMSELKDNGAVAFSDDGKPLENLKLYRVALEYADSLGALIISHSEDSSLASGGVINEGAASTRLGLQGISDLAESVAVARELEVLRYSGGKLHFAHISTKRSIELIRQAKKDGLNVTCETAPHYFSLCDEDIKTFEAKFKMNPPLRSREDKEAVIEGLQDGTIDVIATDHAPHTLEEKLMPIQKAPMGIVGFETSLGLCITNLVDGGYLTLSQVIEKLSLNPSRILNIKQGNIKIGEPANLTVVDPDVEWIVDASKFKSKCKISPFDGKKLRGRVLAVVVNGKYKEIQ
ncbi:MAG TPA: dihydroorotase [Candidatus Adamsella sp.]|nr:dihydroorotase [Candidatus Adamsella sp.]